MLQFQSSLSFSLRLHHNLLTVPHAHLRAIWLRRGSPNFQSHLAPAQRSGPQLGVTLRDLKVRNIITKRCIRIQSEEEIQLSIRSTHVPALEVKYNRDDGRDNSPDKSHDEKKNEDDDRRRRSFNALLEIVKDHLKWHFPCMPFLRFWRGKKQIEYFMTEKCY